MSNNILNINSSFVTAEISNSYCDGNDRHDHVANKPHLFDLCSNQVPAPGRPPAPGSQKTIRNIVTGSYIRLPERAFCFAYKLHYVYLMQRHCMDDLSIAQALHGSIDSTTTALSALHLANLFMSLKTNLYNSSTLWCHLLFGVRQKQ